ncbi:YhfC family glutamic-type intramembrane protease [Sporosarcina trichiuri]|uniref:YhfC family glutamic-type intramembrane protease n=1 Tax=Sporosarcina trichiuri TaxID=3056445 RepID=UPI0025B32410|nr:YhfC family glutamic-type intramembrane protease [Sporosarcina sp. 0.2-SM1T-5]WJY27574.1 YhfC family glutamic-type intramembrane protease [Sporosarcina sp. 0.2-SM1T-5]
MAGMPEAIIISIVLPFVLFGISIGRRRAPAFLLGVLTYVLGLLVIRLHLPDHLLGRSRMLEIWQMRHPAVFSVLIGSAGAAAGELLRLLVMFILLKRKTWQSAVFFGAGQGSAEVLVLVGVPAVGALVSPSIPQHPDVYAAVSIEQLCIMMMQIGLSVLMLQCIRRRDWRYLAAAVVSHTAIVTTVGFLPFIMHPAHQLAAILTVFIAGGLLLAGYAVVSKKKIDTSNRDWF